MKEKTIYVDDDVICPYCSTVLVEGASEDVEPKDCPHLVIYWEPMGEEPGEGIALDFLIHVEMQAPSCERMMSIGFKEC